MSLEIEQIAETFCSHRFAETHSLTENKKEVSKTGER